MSLFDINFLLRTLKADEPQNLNLVAFYERKKAEALKRVNQRIKAELSKI